MTTVKFRRDEYNKIKEQRGDYEPPKIFFGKTGDSKKPEKSREEKLQEKMTDNRNANLANPDIPVEELGYNEFDLLEEAWHGPDKIKMTTNDEESYPFIYRKTHHELTLDYSDLNTTPLYRWLTCLINDTEKTHEVMLDWSKSSSDKNLILGIDNENNLQFYINSEFMTQIDKWLNMVRVKGHGWSSGSGKKEERGVGKGEVGNEVKKPVKEEGEF